MMQSLAPVFAYLQQHVLLFLVMGFGYFVRPDFVTNVFQWFEDKVNLVKFSLGGVNVDFSNYDWDDSLNHFLRDYVISLQGKASAIEGQVIGGGMDTSSGDQMIADLWKQVVADFSTNAPVNLQQYITNKFGGDKVMAAEFLFRRVLAIAHDLNLLTPGSAAKSAVAAKKKV